MYLLPDKKTEKQTALKKGGNFTTSGRDKTPLHYGQKGQEKDSQGPELKIRGKVE